MDYKIIGFNERLGQIGVMCEHRTFCVDLPIKDGAFPVGEELDKLIQDFIPVWAFERDRLLANGVSNADEIHALVEQPNEPLPAETPTPDQLALRQQQEAIFARAIEQKVVSVLIKHGILDASANTINGASL